MWIDTHCHLDAPELAAWGGGMTLLPAGAGPTWVTSPDRVPTPRRLAREQGVALCVLPAVEVGNFDAVRQLAHRSGDAYALGIHPLCVPRMQADDLKRLDDELTAHRDDPRLVAVGEIGLDFFVPALCSAEMKERQHAVYRAQLQLARKHGLPVLLHVRKSADGLLKQLREVWGLRSGQPVPPGCAGIAHAFNGSPEQARAFLALGFKLGIGGVVTFDGAHRLRRLATDLPADAWVMETDAPDIPPQWLYATAAQRAAGQTQGINTPAELPRIGGVMAGLRGVPLADWASRTTANALAALPKVATLLTDLEGMPGAV